MKLSTITAIAVFFLGQSALAEGDPAEGERVFKKCASCHSIEEGKKKLGPSLFGIVGRVAGTVEGFKYSKPMATADFAWDEETLTGFLENPKKFMKGTKMSFPGIKKETDMANLLAYLDSL